MKKFLIVLVLGYALLGTVFFLMAQSGHKAKQGTSRSAQDAAAMRASGDRSLQQGRGFSEGKRDGAVKKAALSDAKNAAAPGMRAFQTFYSDGRVSSVWSFREGVLDGTVLFYHPNGAVWLEYPFSSGQETGTEKEYDASGRLLFEKQMMTGTPQGEIKQFYAGAQPWIRAVVTKGVFEGMPEIYSEGGGKTAGAVSAPALTEGQGVFRVLSESGAPKAEWSGAGGSGAVAKSFYADGKVSSEWPQKDGRPHGDVRFYYPGGSLWREVPLEAGMIAGKVMTYYPGGAVLRETPYSGGRKEGAARLYYEDGSLWAEFFFHEGRLDGYPKAYSQGKTEGALPEKAAARAA